MKLSTAFVLITALTGGTAANAASALSDNYEFEYSAVGMGGGKTASSHYDIVGHIDDTSGLAKSSSTDYSIEPVIGGSDDGESSVADWAIYR